MNQKDLTFYKDLLLKKRKEMVSHMDSITSSERESTIKESSGDHSAYAFHMADQGTDTMEREYNFFYAQRDGQLLSHIERALERIKAGDFGNCRSCTNEIGRARLEAVPHATLCIECKSHQEKLPPISTEEDAEEEAD
ncbi:TraR/DksA family transcriptional regulator [candidate division KSB1 bacterium]|nr:TraR/DksA family transcriptional regulator [candidate division KSB1 bacterium]